VLALWPIGHLFYAWNKEIVMSMPQERYLAEPSRFTVRLSPEAKKAVDEIVDLGGFSSAQEAIRRAIADERYLQRQRSEGWTVLLKKGKEYRELVWPTEMR
jgi:Arc/MetJ-type ribon-helix-helix transcriptional regulator